MDLKALKEKDEQVKLSELLLPKQKLAWSYLSDDKTVEVLYGGAAGGGKAQPIDEPLLTASGKWIKIGNILRGTLLAHPSGNYTKVIAAHKISYKDVYRIVFSDGAKTEACADHLWTVERYGEQMNITTLELFENDKKGLKGERYKFPLTAPLDFAFEKKRLIRHRKDGDRWGLPDSHFKIGVLTAKLNKIPPKVYVHGRLSDRRYFVQGMVSVLGKLCPSGKIEFRTPKIKVARRMQAIFRSMGAMAQFKNPPDGGYLIEVISNHNEIFLVDYDKRLEAKKSIKKSRKKGRRIRSIKYIGKKKSRCITVDNPDGLYITRDYIVTHNSVIGGVWLAVMCLQYPGTKWMMGRSKLKTLKETTLATFFEITSALSWADLYTYNQQAGLIKWKNGSMILLKDLYSYPSDPEFESLGSLEITGAFIDECSQISHKAKSIVRSRIRFKLTKYNLLPKILMTCNPSRGWVYSEFYKPWSEGKLDKDKMFIPALVKDNPYLPESYIESLQSLDKVSRERLLHGNFEYDDDPMALIEYDAQVDIFQNSHLPLEGDKFMTCDVAMMGSDKLVICIWHGWVVIEDLELNKSDGERVLLEIKKLKKKHRIPNTRIVYDADGIGGYLGGFLRGARAFKNNSSPLKADGMKENYRNLKSQCYFRLAEKINNREVWIKIHKTHDEQERIKEELAQVKRKDHDNDGKLSIISKDEIREAIGRSPDYTDALMMRIFFDLKGNGIWNKL